MGVEYSMDDLTDDGWVLILAYVVALSVLFWYVSQVIKLERVRRKHNDNIWTDSDDPETTKDVDDPLLACIAKTGCMKPRMRVKGEFGARLVLRPGVQRVLGGLNSDGTLNEVHIKSPHNPTCGLAEEEGRGR